jgi:hypothetical protein
MDFYLLGYRANAYGSHAREYFWSGPFESRKEALASGRRSQERGRCKGFIDYVRGTNTVHGGLIPFLKACKKVGINPNVREVVGETIDEKIAWIQKGQVSV